MYDLEFPYKLFEQGFQKAYINGNKFYIYGSGKTLYSLLSDL